MTDQDIEHEIQAKGLTAPRVTSADIENEIISEHYFTAAQGVMGCDAEEGFDVEPVPANHPLALLTFCVLVLRNGYTVTGQSACVAAENFSVEIGRKVARQKAVDQIWHLLGFRLMDKLAATN